jgi:SAM-dependent methyltransferase
MTQVDPFARAGMARRSDLDSPAWKRLFLPLEQRQSTFLELDGQFRSPEYRWPRDPLHTWSRVWEYPYVIRFLQEFRSRFNDTRLLRAADFGSGVTFFPFAVADLGFEVTCLDNDPVCIRDLDQAVRVVPVPKGRVQSRLTESRFPLSDGEMDVVYSISVIEHIPKFEPVLDEVRRVLRPGGWFIATVDIALYPGYDIGSARHADLLRELSIGFRPIATDATVHPLDLITPSCSTFPMEGPRGLGLAWFYVKQRILKPLLGLTPTPNPIPQLTVQAIALERV